jgi:hypothetical protein
MNETEERRGGDMNNLSTGGFIHWKIMSEDCALAARSRSGLEEASPVCDKCSLFTQLINMIQIDRPTEYQSQCE